MSWLYGQAWLWYLTAFAVGVLIAWLLLVRPQQRRLATLPGRQARDRADQDRAAATVAGRPDEPPPVDDAATEQIPATNPALSTLDTLATGPQRVTTNTPGGAATAGLGAAGLGDAAVPDDATGTDAPADPEAGTDQK